MLPRIIIPVRPTPRLRVRRDAMPAGVDHQPVGKITLADCQKAWSAFWKRGGVMQTK